MRLAAGANFQSVSVNQKLNQSTSVKTGLTDLGGYANSADTPNPLTVEALDFIDNLVGAYSLWVHLRSACTCLTAAPGVALRGGR